jgi:alanyl aminopeptidase
VKDATLTIDREKLAAKVIGDPQDYVGFAFDHPVGPGEATLRVVYQGEISRKDQQGIFQMKDGGRWYVYSQFEAIWARRAFPVSTSRLTKCRGNDSAGQEGPGGAFECTYSV